MMTRDELIQRLVGRTIVGVDQGPGGEIYLRLDGGDELELSVGTSYDGPCVKAEFTRLNQPGFAGSMWGEVRAFDGVELVPHVVAGKIESLFVQAIHDDPPPGSHAVNRVLDSNGLTTRPIATKVDTSAIEKAWLGRPYSDWLALPR